MSDQSRVRRLCVMHGLLFCNQVITVRFLQYESVHHDKVAHASAHHEEMENLMGTEIFVAVVENRKLQCIDDTADCINDTARKKRSECCRGKGI